MPCGSIVRPVLQCFTDKRIKFYFTVAEHIRIGSTSEGVLVKHVIDHPGPVFDAEVDCTKLDAEAFGHHFGKSDILVKRTVSLKQTPVIMPVDHEESFHFIALLFQDMCRYAGVNPA